MLDKLSSQGEVVFKSRSEIVEAGQHLIVL